MKHKLVRGCKKEDERRKVWNNLEEEVKNNVERVMHVKQISPIPIEVVWGIRKRNAEISTVSTNGTCLKNNEYVQSEQERILEMKVKSLMTLNKCHSSFSHQHF